MSSRLPTASSVPGDFFYFPSESATRNQLEVSCVDSTHLLTRTRRKCCKGGIEGLTNEPWRQVALRGNTPLALGMVDAVTESMSVSTARCHFTESVEEDMRLYGDSKAADLCRDIREWWEAEDDAAIPSTVRIEKRMRLRKRLISYVNFGYFPPPGMYVNGWPCQLWEALIASIDAKYHLYGLTKNHMYHSRAFASMMGETFFAELTLFDKRGHGTVTTTEFGRFISSTVQAMDIRLDPNRSFYYRTSRKTAYELVDKYEKVDEDENSDSDTTVIIRDHKFDRPERARVPGKKKVATIKRERNSFRKGALGVRYDGGARRNEAKMLATLKMGLDV